MKEEVTKEEGLKAERVQYRYSFLYGWVLVDERGQGVFEGKEKPFIWTAYELADHLEACELVAQIGKIADRFCVAPELDVRRNYLFVTVGKEEGLTDADFDFAEALDDEVGPRQKANGLVAKIS